MSQLFANANDAGRGRNMPVHYGQNYPRMVGVQNLSRYLVLIQSRDSILYHPH